MKIFAIISIVIVLLLGCCGGCLYTGYYMMVHGSFEPVKVQIEGTPTIEQYIGTVDSGTLSWNNSLSDWEKGRNQRMSFDVSGPKGTGLLIIKQGSEGLNKLDWAILEIDGETHVVLGTPPDDLDAEASSSKDSDEKTDSDDEKKDASAEESAEIPAETATDKE